MLNKDERNFHAWGYRRVIAAELESSKLQGGCTAEAEFSFTTKMIHRNLSKSSAWYHRIQLIPALLNERRADALMRAAFLDEELNFVRGRLNVGPHDESPWHYHDFLISQIINGGIKTCVFHLSTSDKVVYLRREIEEIRDLLEDYASVKRIYARLLEYHLALNRLGYSSEPTDGIHDAYDGL
ncbi:hypothetical protein ACQKWADRAFT_302281 [Trichoderma austrokoningii]